MRRIRPLALFHGLADVASDTAGMSPRFNPRPLPNDETDIPTLKSWFRQFVEVRDAQAGERAIVSALRAGADDKQIADMLFTAATDHRYLAAGHTLDFINKALESVDLTGWENAELAFHQRRTQPHRSPPHGRIQRLAQTHRPHPNPGDRL